MPITLNLYDRMTIYLITNLINGKKYVGQTIRPLSVRWYFHVHQTNCRVMARAIKKYGKENFTIEELFKAQSQEELDRKEIEFILALNTLAPGGYNLTEGGNGGSKWLTMTDNEKRITLKKLSDATNHKKIKVFCVENGKTYESIMAASRDTGVSSGNISYALQGIKYRYKGYTFKRA
jgi:hypothetical protein